MFISFVASEMVLFILVLHQILLNEFMNIKIISLMVLPKNIMSTISFGMKSTNLKRAPLPERNK